MKKIVFILLILFIVLPADDFKDYFFNISGKINNTLLVDKNRQKLFVIAENSDRELEIIDEFRVTTGRVIGDKEEEGDLKTPEGIYTIVRKLDDDKLPEKYGPLAYVLNYPNEVDRIFNRNGSNIWIHGRNEDIKDYQTEGCVSLENSHILDLAKYLSLNDTKIIILDSLQNNGHYSIEYKQRLQNFLTDWAESWSRGDLENYFNKYSDKFRENGHDFKTFQARKRQLEKIYNWKKVELDSISFLISKSEIFANFQQTYISPRFISKGQKTLIILDDENEFKIVREHFVRTGKRVEMMAELSKFVEAWQRAWESVDIEQYIAFYAEKFDAEGKSKNWWYQDKKEKFSAISKLSIKTTNLTSYSTKENQWVVTFNQDYRADNYQDYGKKTLVVEKTGQGNFKIINEFWRPLR